MKFNIIDFNGDVVSELDAPDSVFGIQANLSVVRQSILAEMTNKSLSASLTKGISIS